MDAPPPVAAAEAELPSAMGKMTVGKMTVEGGGEAAAAAEEKGEQQQRVSVAAAQLPTVSRTPFSQSAALLTLSATACGYSC